MPKSHYTAVLIGTGFASSFFLHRFLSRAAPTDRILVLERGPRIRHRDLLADHGLASRAAADSFDNRTAHKPWLFDLAVGGTSNSWFGNTPRLTVDDFRSGSRFARGADWPLSYADLEPHYAEAEALLAVAGEGSPAAIPRSGPFPQGPHARTAPDLLLGEAWPEEHFAMPCARPTRRTERRPACCATGFCNLCPIDSKFTVLNEMSGLFEDPRVDLLHGTPALEVLSRGGLATGVRYRVDERELEAGADLVVLGAHAIMNPYLLLRSGLDDGVVGRGLCEQVGVVVDVLLDGLDGFQGSTSHTGLGYMLYRPEDRAGSAGGLLEVWNTPFLRSEPGRWRQRQPLKVVFEDEPSQKSAVLIDPDRPDRPTVAWSGPSERTLRAVRELPERLEKVLAPLPIESIEVHQPVPTEGHILSTTPMGLDPVASVVDRSLIHHRLRNLLVLGSGAFPSCPAGNPTLTLCALSLWAADRLA